MTPSDESLDALAREIESDRELHSRNSYDLKDPKLAVLLDGLLERGLIDESAMLSKALYPDPETFEIMNRAHLLSHASRWARDRVRQLDGKEPINAPQPNPPQKPTPQAFAPQRRRRK